MSFIVTDEITLATNVADAGTFNVSYPAGTSQASNWQSAHEMMVNHNDLYRAVDGDISVSFGASNITVTNNTGKTLAAGTAVRLQFDMLDEGVGPAVADVAAAPTQADFNNLLASLRIAGVIASS